MTLRISWGSSFDMSESFIVLSQDRTDVGELMPRSRTERAPLFPCVPGIHLSQQGSFYLGGT